MHSEGIQSELGQLTSAPQSESAPPVADEGASPRSDVTSQLTEDRHLALLQHRDLSPETIEQLSQNLAAMKSRKICLAMAAHPRTPRHLALRLVRQLYTFDLMRFALHPVAASDLKRVADGQLVARLASITLGERLTLARRASETVAAALLLDKESRVSHTALENPRLTEATVIKALMSPNARAAIVEAVCHHSKWSLRREIRLALLRNPHTPLARALEFARTLPPPVLRDTLHTSRLPEKVKNLLLKELENRK
ncbi:MAG: hypothetical protein WCA16_10460 [Candidatus Sulfotelmatobacter sp.]